MKNNFIKTAFKLPCGAVIKNRLVKAALTERISDKNLEPTAKHQFLYKKWAETEAGLLITGNVMVDAIHMESAGNVYVGDESILPKMKLWAAAGKTKGNHIWTQISHAGRQTNKFLARRPLAPSEVQLHQLGLFGKPRVMTEADIQKVIKGFVRTATICKKAGFTGIQLHAAHGYLLSQFLSPVTNVRTDKWGGSLENRSRLLRIILDEIRAAVGADFPIGVKLNSSDFQKGGFTEEESLEVIKMLDGRIDLLEVSGGTYEKFVVFEMNEDAPKMKESTQKREAYFMDFSKKVRQVTNLPLMITGGCRSFNFCNEALADKELDFIGMGRPFITNINQIADFIDGKVDRLENLVIRTGVKTFDTAAEGGFYAKQLINLANGKPVNLKMWASAGSMFFTYHEFKKAMINKFS